jgi:hypothetical protein
MDKWDRLDRPPKNEATWPFHSRDFLMFLISSFFCARHFSDKAKPMTMTIFSDDPVARRTIGPNLLLVSKEQGGPTLNFYWVITPLFIVIKPP